MKGFLGSLSVFMVESLKVMGETLMWIDTRSLAVERGCYKLTPSLL